MVAVWGSDEDHCMPLCDIYQNVALLIYDVYLVEINKDLIFPTNLAKNLFS